MRNGRAACRMDRSSPTKGVLRSPRAASKATSGSGSGTVPLSVLTLASPVQPVFFGPPRATMSTCSIVTAVGQLSPSHGVADGQLPMLLPA